MVPKEEIANVWPSVVDLIDSAVKHNNGEFTTEDVFKHLSDGKETLWVIADDSIRGCFTTTIYEYERKNVLFIILLAGSAMKDWKDLEPKLVEFARLNRCSDIQSFIIPSLNRLIQRYYKDYKVTHIVVSKKL